MPSDQSKPTLHELQLLRAMAASLVVIDHATAQVLEWPGSPLWMREFGWFLGEQGVAIFFVISGFIMSFTAKEFGSGGYARRFLLRRIARVVPLYWIFTTVAAILIGGGFWLKGRSLSIGELAMSLAFIPYGTPPMRPVLGQGWTLEYEMIFYLVFAISLFFSRKTAHLFLAAILVLAVAIGYIAFGAETGEKGRNAFAYFLAPYLLLFLLGVIAGYFQLYVRTRMPIACIVLLIAAEVIMFIFAKPEFTSVYWRFVFWTLDFVIVLISLDGLAERRTPFRIRLFERLGDASYSLYLSHIFLVYAVARLWRNLLGEQFPWAYIATSVAISAVAAMVIYQFLEQPLYIKTKSILEPRYQRKRKSSLAHWPPTPKHNHSEQRNATHENGDKG